MKITTSVSFVTKDQRQKLINLMQIALEKEGFEQAQIDEILYEALDSRLCDLEELVPLVTIKEIIKI